MKWIGLGILWNVAYKMYRDGVATDGLVFVIVLFVTAAALAPEKK